MMLYHVSMGWDELQKQFTPRVPECRAYCEDDKIKRICLSDSIGGCLSAIPDRPPRTYEWKKLTVYKCDVDGYIGYEELYRTGMVFDAYLTHEHWCLKPIKMSGCHMWLRDYDVSYEYVPEEKYADIFISYAVDYLKNHGVAIPDGIKKRLYDCSMIEAMYSIFSQIFYENDLDLDNVSKRMLSLMGIISNPELAIEA